MCNNKIEERLKKINEVSDQLKKEFIGIDSIIDQIIENIIPWYVTPEIITRPTTISLWGLTGTGKTSVAKRLLDLLGISGNCLYFNCASEVSSQKDSLDSKLENFYSDYDDGTKAAISLSSFEDDPNVRNPVRSIIILDEFQNCRTIDESNMEKDRSQTGVIWQLLDSGHVEIISYSWEKARLIATIEDLFSLAIDNYTIPMKNGKFGITGEELENIDSSFREYLEYNSLYVFKDSGKKNNLLKEVISDEDTDDKPEEEKDEIETPSIISSNLEMYLVKLLNSYKPRYGWDTRKKLRESKTLGDYCENLKELSDLLSKPKELDFSKALVFVIGNLDEAFGVGDGVDPDIDADILHKITSSVTITDVKNSLKRRFRLEQISRLGNNMVLYPSLRKEDFRIIIDMELSKISESFKELCGFEVSFTEKMKNLVYSEAVYPIQGVRPIHSTISSLVTPKFSKVLMNRPKESVSAVIDVLDDCFEKDSVTLLITYNTGDTVELKQDLILGGLRDVSKYSKLPLQAVHEAGHAVVYSLLTGKMPETIVAITTLGGGYMYPCCDKDYSSDRQAQNREEMENSVMVSLAGVLAESVVFPEKGKLSLGGSSDLREAWENLAHAFYDCAYGDNYIKYRKVTDTPLGLDPDDRPADFSRNDQLIKLNDRLIKKTTTLIIENLEFIKEVAKYLVANRTMGREKFKEFYDKYNTKEIQNVGEWYKSKLFGE